MEKSLKISTKTLRRGLAPAMALLLALTLTVSAGMWANSAALDDYFGRGARTITVVEGSGGWDRTYYPRLYANARESRAAAAALSKTVSDEGIVLLKNDGLLPLSPSAEISPFGLRYVDPYYGGAGSSAIDPGADYVVTAQEGLHRAFGRINAALEEKLLQAYEPGTDPAGNPGITAAVPLDGGEGVIHEFDSALYQGTESACSGTVGVVFVGRRTGESADAHAGAYSDGTPHMLALTAAERAAVDFAKAHCAGVVVVLESSAPMQIAALEDDGGVNAILWVGGAGSGGYESLGDILAGKVVPSGRLPDCYPSDFTRDPTFANFDDGSDRFVYANAYTTLVGNYDVRENANAPFHEYEEGVYLGYRYYETAYDLGFLQDYYNRTDGVVYPFGYGLSYTSFSQRILSFSQSGGSIAVTVRVTNTGRRYTGKDVVQLYCTTPYTQFDRDYDIEKPTAVLLQFEKTGPIAPGEYEDVEITVPWEAMASYCSTRRNGDGTAGCYVLEEGDYILSVRSDSHTVLDQRTAHAPATVWYDNDHPRQAEISAQSPLDQNGGVLSYPARSGAAYQAAVNRFSLLSAYMADPAVSSVTVLSRKDWAGTQPTAPTDQDRNASDTVVQWIAAYDTAKYDYASDSRLGNNPGSLVYRAEAPLTGEENGMVLADLRGKSYYDPMWDLLLNQLTFSDAEELRRCLFEDAYHTGAVKAIGKPETLERDGPQGLTLADQAGRNWLSGTCAYPSAPVMAATWSKPLMYELGYMVGQEALVAEVNGWYAPGLNLHRSPFGGRAAEYLSEDAVLSGYLGAQIISGAGDAGVYCAVKHLVLMDTEGHRNPHTAVWLTEQALREVYLKPFEIALTTARKTIRYIADEAGTSRTRTMRAGDFVMTADCAVGACWTSASYELLTQVLREEWGFQGAVISDMNLNSNAGRIDMMLRAGCDALMSTPNGARATVQDAESPTGQGLLREAVKNICYVTVNSNLTQGAAPGSIIQYALSPWAVGLLVFDGAAAVLTAALSAWLVLRARDERKNPHRYRR